MRGSVSALPHTSSWGSAQLSTGYTFMVKERDNFTFNFDGDN